jgi:hypothetical protein
MHEAATTSTGTSDLEQKYLDIRRVQFLGFAHAVALSLRRLNLLQNLDAWLVVGLS